MVVRNLNVDWARRTCRPLEANPPLVIDADAVLTGTVAFESFQSISADCGEIFEAGRGIETIEPSLGLSGETGKLLDVFAGGETGGLPVPVTHDHWEKV
jgi:hypothetical protein